MRKHKGKWIVNVKDTYHIEEINSAVLAHIQKLYDTIKDKEVVGIPMYYCDKQAELQGIDHHSDDIDLDAAHQLRLRDLEELIWTYTDNEPDIMSYDFEINFLEGSPTGRGTTTYETEVINQEGMDKYRADEIAYWERTISGYALAGKIWRELQW